MIGKDQNHLICNQNNCFINRFAREYYKNFKWISKLEIRACNKFFNTVLFVFHLFSSKNIFKNGENLVIFISYRNLIL